MGRVDLNLKITNFWRRNKPTGNRIRRWKRGSVIVRLYRRRPQNWNDPFRYPVQTTPFCMRFSYHFSATQQYGLFPSISSSRYKTSNSSSSFIFFNKKNSFFDRIIVFGLFFRSWFLAISTFRNPSVRLSFFRFVTFAFSSHFLRRLIRYVCRFFFFLFHANLSDEKLNMISWVSLFLFERTPNSFELRFIFYSRVLFVFVYSPAKFWNLKSVVWWGLVRGITRSDLGSILLLVCNGFGDLGWVCFYFVTAVMVMIMLVVAEIIFCGFYHIELNFWSPFSF